MKIKYIGKKLEDFVIKDNHIDLITGKIYNVMSVEKDWYRIIDESEEDYLYPPGLFEVVEQ